MSEPLVVVDRSTFRRDRLEDLRNGFGALAAFVRHEEPRPIAYHVYLNDGAGTVTVVQIHPDAASLAEHMEVAGPRFTLFAELLEMTSLDVYGAPDDAVLQRLGAKASMLGTGGLSVHQRIAGFERFGGGA